jgi:hypothetical protein
MEAATERGWLGMTARTKLTQADVDRIHGHAASA